MEQAAVGQRTEPVRTNGALSMIISTMETEVTT